MQTQTARLDPRLAPYASKVFLIRFSRADLRTAYYRMLPTGTGRLVYQRISGPAPLKGRTGHVLFALGPYRRLVNGSVAARETIGIELRPGALGPLLGRGAHALKDDILPLASAWGRRYVQELLREMAAARDIRERWRIIQKALLERVKGTALPDPRVTRGVERIHRSGGTLRMEALAEELECTTRHLARRFEEGLGLSPKQYSRVVRARLLLEDYVSGLRPQLSALCHDRGFHDQAHANRDFKTLLGMAPGEFQRDLSAPAGEYLRALDVIQKPAPGSLVPLFPAMRSRLARLLDSAVFR